MGYYTVEYTVSVFDRKTARYNDSKPKVIFKSEYYTEAITALTKEAAKFLNEREDRVVKSMTDSNIAVGRDDDGERYSTYYYFTLVPYGF